MHIEDTYFPSALRHEISVLRGVSLGERSGWTDLPFSEVGTAAVDIKGSRLEVVTLVVGIGKEVAKLLERRIKRGSTRSSVL